MYLADSVWLNKLSWIHNLHLEISERILGDFSVETLRREFSAVNGVSSYQFLSKNRLLTYFHGNVWLLLLLTVGIMRDRFISFM
jgi:hypothetical protein